MLEQQLLSGVRFFIWTFALWSLLITFRDFLSNGYKHETYPIPRVFVATGILMGLTIPTFGQTFTFLTVYAEHYFLQRYLSPLAFMFVATGLAFSVSISQGRKGYVAFVYFSLLALSLAASFGGIV